MQSYADNNISTAFLLGSANQRTERDSMKITSGDDNSIGLRVIYSISSYIAFEFAYHDFGETDDTFIDKSIDPSGGTITHEIDTTAIELGIKGSVPISNGFSVNGRIGTSKWDWDAKSTYSSLPGQLIKENDDGADLYYGAGLQFDISENIYIGAEYNVRKMNLKLNGSKLEHRVKNLSAFLGFAF